MIDIINALTPPVIVLKQWNLRPYKITSNTVAKGFFVNKTIFLLSHRMSRMDPLISAILELVQG